MKRQPASNRSVKEPKLSRAHPPVDLAPADWQRALRRQFGRDQAFVLENRGDQPFFSEFRVSNPQSKTSYRVAIRGLNAGDNYCSCPDYATNELGTCKHIEFVLARLEKKRGAKAAFARGWRPAFSEIYLRNDGERAVYFRAGSDCPPAVIKAASRFFDSARGGVLPEERFGELEHFLATAAKNGHELRAYDDALDFVAGRRDAVRRTEVLDSLFPRGASDRKLAQLAQGAAVSLPGRRRALRGARRPRPDRRRDGPGQDHPGHCGDGNPGATFRRLARAGGVPDLAQVPVAKRNQPLFRPCRAGDGRRPGAAARRISAPTISARSPTTRS